MARVFQDSDPIEVLKLSPGICTSLQDEGIMTIGELCSRTERVMTGGIGKIGPQRMRDIEEALARGGRQLGERITIGPQGQRINWPPNNRNSAEKLAELWYERAEKTRGVFDYRYSAGRMSVLLQCARQVLALVGHVFIKVDEHYFCHLIPVGKGKVRQWMARFEGEIPWPSRRCALCGDFKHRAERCTSLNEPRVLSAEDVAEMKKKYEEYEE